MQSLLFSTEMVRALMDNRKTETRRLRGLDEVNQNPDRWKVCGHSRYDNRVWWMLTEKARPYHSEVERMVIPCPFKIGPCWVRETFSKIYYEWVDAEPTFIYKADDDNSGLDRIWKPSIHMPFIAARNFIHIDDVRPERLNDITEEGAIAEGVEPVTTDPKTHRSHYMNYPVHKGYQFSAIESFQSLITSINGPECWEKNMWVWVIKFHRISKPD